METCTSCARLVLQGCDFQLELDFAYLRVLDLYYKVAIFQLKLEACTSRVRLVLQSCDFSSWSWKPVLRALDLRFKVVIFLKPLLRALYLCHQVAFFQLELEACTLRARLALQSCDLPARTRLLIDTSEHNF